MSNNKIPASPDSSSELDGRKLALVDALARIVEPLEQSLQKHDENMKALLEAKHMIRKVSSRWLVSTAAALLVVLVGAWITWQAFGRLDSLLTQQAAQAEQQAAVAKQQTELVEKLQGELDAIPRLEIKAAPSSDPTADPVVVLRGKTKTASSARPGHPAPPAAKSIEVELEVPTKKRRPKKGKPTK